MARGGVWLPIPPNPGEPSADRPRSGLRHITTTDPKAEFERIALKRVLCYKSGAMTNRLTVAAFMVAALFVSAVRLPASACPVSSPPIGQACKPGSCPNKACCANAEKNKSWPSIPLAQHDSAGQQLVAIVAPSPATCLVAVQPVERLTDASAHGVAASATPKRVFLCTFLI